MSQTQDHRFSLNSNTAGAPLPLIPRRTSSSRPTLTPSPSLPLPTRSSLTSSASYPSSSITFSPGGGGARYPARNDSDSSSSSSSPSDGTRPTIRTRRVRGVRNPAVCAAELSTPVPKQSPVTTPAHPQKGVAFPSADSASNKPPHAGPSRPLLYTPGMSLRLCAESLKAPRNVSESHVSHPGETSAQGAQSASALCESFGEARLIRKKSGQLVKSSLKSSRSASRNNLSVFTFPQSSKSEPTTPTSKAVHFDSKLEHVKLFLAEQKPLAVSRDGSPTDDTSGTDSDFPRFIYGDEEDRRPRKKLVMQVANMPARINPYSDVALEELTLSGDGSSIYGKVRVRNLAFSKWVAVRFTFDAWQTTSEVTGKYCDSVDSDFDRFSFTIRLNDLLARIEGKTLVLAVKYSIEGKEMWDNNNGQNYMATFTKTKATPPPSEEPRATPPPRKTTLSDDEASTDMADLRSKLEKVVQSNDRRPQVPASADATLSSFRGSSSFASRYDISASLKSSWNPEHQAQPLHSRTQSFPISAASRSSSSSIPWPQKSPSDPYAFRHAAPHHPAAYSTPAPIKSKPAANLGSPRDIGEDAFCTVPPRQNFEYEDAPFPVQQPRPVRNHQRGYFDISISPSPSFVKRTPPGTPREHDELFVSSPQRYNSFPPLEPSRNVLPPSMSALSSAGFRGVYREDVVDSELSTPSMATPSSSRESTPSPTEMFGNESETGLSPDTHYRQFLNKFCFFTGPDVAVNPQRQQQHQRQQHQQLQRVEDAELIPRTHSASDIEEFLSSLHTLADDEPVSISPIRSSSLDDLYLNSNRSGSITPTVSRLAMANSNSNSNSVAQMTTPVLL
ncbi:Serine/threonine-protein phosphatase 1 regulatory subunit GAC1 [Psilocybe cubensis]|uniref:Serine/threonine-protein phosphatase 1 regulatory subunit GAC1 n=2 Tax=Psilocybe cubensis TaxID=181762 RepID=A0ACB8H793_PSICU|nr:Serine/threonine-protein phosphatase 1 regulatory subunit GAC1 [Psilocybe cubensis]KAH9483585.1 Serine/threonine-protein phosphatase 1 regulatory subunit GAC1 [Psilocybe cubensis]